MQDIVITLVFSLIFFMFAIWPAIKIVDFIDSKNPLNEKTRNRLTLFFSIIIALLAGLFMSYY